MSNIDEHYERIKTLNTQDGWPPEVLADQGGRHCHETMHANHARSEALEGKRKHEVFTLSYEQYKEYRLSVSGTLMRCKEKLSQRQL